MITEEIITGLINGYDESEVVERKEAKKQFDLNKLGKYFSALSNEANLCSKDSAWVVFGVSDNKTVVGTNFRTNSGGLPSLKKEIADKITNRLTFINIHERKVDGKRVVLFQIPPAPQGIPVAWSGHYYGRDGASLGALNLHEIELIRSQNRARDWSAITLPGASIEDLDANAIIQARKMFAQKNPKIDEVNHWDDRTFLNKAKLTINGLITRAAVLLLGKSESSHWLNPSSPTITWVLKDRNGLAQDYAHFSCPLLLNINRVLHKIRNLRYRYISDDTLFPEEVDQYDPYIIREALNNAIMHQDYELGGKITLVEFEDARLCFSNHGGFIPGSLESVIQADAPESRYRNRFLADAMVNLNMVDTIGSGIKKMFMIQKDRFFPLPEYNLNNKRVEVSITGRVLDLAYARKLAQLPDMSLDDIMLLDRVQKNKSLNSKQAGYLKEKGLIEGRKPNYHISAQLAKYIQHRAFDDQHYKKMILEYLEKFGEANRSDFDRLLSNKLPAVLDEKQKKNKIKNLLQSLKIKGLVKPEGKSWRMSK